MGTRIHDLSGQSFGKWTVLYWIPGTNEKAGAWMCECDCGTRLEISSSRLLKGKTVACRSCRRTKPNGEAAFTKVFHNYQNGAKRRGYSFDLSRDEVKMLTKQNCTYCGSEPITIMETQSGVSYTYNGIDRVDNTKGYSLENVVTCCTMCNKMKETLDVDTFLSHINKIADYRRTE